MKNPNLLRTAGLLALALFANTALLAQSAPPAPSGPAASASALPLVDAEIRKLDLATGKVTLKHGDIPNLDMPGMTMVFQARTPAQLQGLKVGDKVRFRADVIKGAYIAMDIAPAP